MGNTLSEGKTLSQGEQLRSSNGRYILSLQPEGDLVLYEGTQTHDTVFWTTDTSDLARTLRPVRAEMESESNFVLHNNLNFQKS